MKKDIDKLEERPMACWGRIVVDGHRNVSVTGCSEFEPTDQVKEPATEQSECHIEEDGLLSLKDVSVEPKPKRRRTTTTRTLDHDFVQLFQTSEEQRQVQADLICSKLDNVVTSIEALTAAQVATTAAIEKLAMALT